MKKLIALLAVVFVGMSLSACQPSENGTDAKPASLVGTWKADGFEATVAENSIEINIVSDDSKSLYWKGTFESGTNKITSIADREALDASMMGSQDSDKVFMIEGDKITFEMSMLGTTKTIKLEKA
jgi:hypothetical protein